jgi:membrane protein DedA with SNARE-associated domain
VFTAGEIYVYVGFFVTLVAAGLGFPAPEELVISGAGVLAGQLPPPPKQVGDEVVLPSEAEVVALLAAAPDAGFPGAVPWAAVVCAGAPSREFSVPEVAALLAAAPDAGFPGAVPWAAVARTPLHLPRPPEVGPKDTPIHVRWWVLLPVCIAGVVISDILLYGIGRRYGDRLLMHRWMARMMPRDKRTRIEANFHRYGVSILVFGRLVPGIRSPLFLTAGTMRLPLARFLLADGLGAVVGNSFFFFLGFWLGDQFKALVNEAEKLKPILIVIALGALGAYLVYVFLRHPVSIGDPQEVPIIGNQVAARIDHEPKAAGDSRAPASGGRQPPVSSDPTGG